MNVDDEIHEKEKIFLLTLLNTFNLPREQLDEFIEFSKSPTEEDLDELLKAIKEADIVNSFLNDCLMVSKADGEVKDSENELYNIYCEILGNSGIDKVKVDNKDSENSEYWLSSEGSIYYKVNGLDNNGYNLILKSQVKKIEVLSISIEYPFFNKNGYSDKYKGYVWFKRNEGNIRFTGGEVNWKL